MNSQGTKQQKCVMRFGNQTDDRKSNYSLVIYRFKKVSSIYPLAFTSNFRHDYLQISLLLRITLKPVADQERSELYDIPSE